MVIVSVKRSMMIVIFVQVVTVVIQRIVTLTVKVIALVRPLWMIVVCVLKVILD